MRSQSREVYTIRWRKDVKQWICPQLNISFSPKTEFIRIMAGRLRHRWRDAMVPCQLRVYGKNGRIQFERTYGRDPRRFRG